MVNPAEVAKILDHPHLEPETIQAVNAYIRRLLEQPASAQPEKEQLQSTLDEWVGGKGVVSVE
ncbi:hypothetical protein [Paenibacillus humicus]|uniref:hypothetical protein n=1 Tax=Paenibacillus humicus TaxID=412861 RepID=UPI003F181CEF